MISSQLAVKISSALIILLFPIFLLLANLTYISRNENFQLKILVRSDRESQAVLKNIHAYFWHKEMLNAEILSYQAQLHLKDVKFILNIQEKILFFISFLLLASGLILTRKNPKLLLDSLHKATKLALILFLAFVPIIIFSFNTFFISLHKIMFSNNLWIFTASDKLIQIFPEEFFLKITVQLFTNLFFISTLLMIIFYAIKKQND